VPLNLLVGRPMRQGERLLEQYSAVLDRRPFLVVPTVAISRDCSEIYSVDRPRCLRKGRHFRRPFSGARGARERAHPSERCAAPVASCARYSIERSSVLLALGSICGFVDALVEGIAELESALVEPGLVEGDLGSLYSLISDELKRLDLAIASSSAGVVEQCDGARYLAC